VDVQAGKTGFIRSAGYCLATLLRLPQSNQTVAVVVLGAKSNAGRFWETRHLFNWLSAKAGRPHRHHRRGGRAGVRELTDRLGRSCLPAGLKTRLLARHSRVQDSATLWASSSQRAVRTDSLRVAQRFVRPVPALHGRGVQRQRGHAVHHWQQGASQPPLIGGLQVSAAHVAAADPIPSIRRRERGNQPTESLLRASRGRSPGRRSHRRPPSAADELPIARRLDHGEVRLAAAQGAFGMSPHRQVW
jgi:hypothetical protein